MWSPAPEQRSSTKTVASWDSTTCPAPVWKSSHQHYLSTYYDDDDFERLFLPGDDSIQSSRVHLPGQSLYSNPNPFVFESNPIMVHPSHHITKDSCAPLQTKQQQYALDMEMFVGESQVHGADDGDHGTFVSSLRPLECPPRFDANNEDDEDTTTGLDDIDKWELKLLFSTLNNAEDQTHAWLSSPTRRASAFSNPTSTGSLMHQDTLLVCGETVMPDNTDSAGTFGKAATSASTEEDPPRVYDSCAPHPVQSSKHDTVKPILTTSFETLGDCFMRTAQPDDAKTREATLDMIAKVTQSDSPVGDNCSVSSRFRIYQEDQWMEQYRELQDFAKETGHTFVPCGYPDRDALARWTKRQRYQYKLRLEGKVSTMTKERIALLDKLGFIWNSQVAVWEKRLSELNQYKRFTGHCNVPSHFAPNQKLATWVKCQRRQYKLLVTGRKSNMTIDRAKILENLGFVWELRSHPQRTKD